MMGPKIVTSAQMHRVDECSIREHGIPGYELMDRAGARVVEAIRDRWDGLEGLRIAVVCGKGNNGADGLVVARRLKHMGVEVDLYLLEPPDRFGEDATVHLDRLAEVDLTPRILDTTTVADFSECDLIVDAILGTGVQGPVRTPQATIIDAVNSSRCPVVAIDLPSGVDGDTGILPGPAIRAHLTVTFDLPKIAHLFHPARGQCGDLALTQIGFPQAAIDACESELRLLTQEWVGANLPEREVTAHKGSCGSVAVIAGSAGMTGAAALTAQGAMRAGAGRVRVGIPRSLHDVLETKVTEAMTRPLPEVRQRRCLSVRALGDVLELVGSSDVAAVGPGLGRHRETMELVRRLFASTNLPPIVVDADGLFAIGDDLSILQRMKTPVVMTPHSGEMARLSGWSVQQVGEDPVGVTRQVAQCTEAVVLLKGSPTVIASADGRTFVNPTGNAGMATAGAGDVLTGLIAGLMAQGVAGQDASCMGAYLHGAAGDRSRDDLGEWGMMAGDLLDRLPQSYLDARHAFNRLK